MAKLSWALALGMGAAALPAWGGEREVSYDTYGDWRAVVMQLEGGGETWRECTASTGGDVLPTLRISARQYDVGPPDAYPAVEIHEQAPRHYNTQMQEGGRVSFTFDDGESFQAVAHAGIAEDVFQFATASPPQEMSLFVLQGMRRAGRLDITHDGALVLAASLAGFTAAYGKIAEGCGFSTMGVIAPLEPGPAGDGGSGDAGDDATLLFEHFGVWRAQAEDFESDGTMVRECFASVAADSGRRLSFSTNSLEAAPPDAFPPLVLSEAIPAAAVPMIARGGRVQFAFDTGLVVPGEVMTDVSQDGTRFVDAAVTPGYRDLALREMRRASALWVYGDGQLIYQTAVDGFGEAYGALARVCAFSTAGVLD